MLVKITPADVDLDYPVSEIFVGSAGTLVLTLVDNSVVTVQASGIVRFGQSIKRVAAASTASLLTADVPDFPASVSITASRNAALTDAGKIIEANSSSAVNVTIQTNSTTAFPVNTILYIYQVGTGASTFVAGSGVTFEGTAPALTRYGYIGIRYRGFDVWSWV